MIEVTAVTATPMIRVTDASTRSEIEQAIVVLRAKAQRWSRVDPRRQAVDDECDELVTLWLGAAG